jgi:hypothetical protein
MKIIIILLLSLSFPFLTNGQTKNYKLDTLIGKYLLRIKVYTENLDENNIKAYFTFYDSSKDGKLQCIYYFKYLPPRELSQGDRYVPIFQDWINRDNSMYLWKDIFNGEFDYNKAREYIVKQNETNNTHKLDSFSVSEISLKEKAKKQFLIAFNGLIKKDYLSFAKSIHPAELKKLSYQLKANYFNELYQKTTFNFTDIKVDSIGKLINFFGELQTVIFVTCTFEINGKSETMKQNIIARSFDKGNIWYYKEIMKNKRNSYFDMSKGNLNEPAISWKLISSLK